MKKYDKVLSEKVQVVLLSAVAVLMFVSSFSIEQKISDQAKAQTTGLPTTTVPATGSNNAATTLDPSLQSILQQATQNQNTQQQSTAQTKQQQQAAAQSTQAIQTAVNNAAQRINTIAQWIAIMLIFALITTVLFWIYALASIRAISRWSKLNPPRKI